MTAKLKKIASNFQFKGELKRIVQNLTGNINKTYRFYYENGNDKYSYTVQAINKYVFKQPELVMKNIDAVTKHIKKKIELAGGDPNRGTLTIIPTNDGKLFYIDEDGEYWRAYYFIDGASTYDTVSDPSHLYHAGVGFGNFQKMLADFPMDELIETIPDFHNTKKRMTTFFESVERDEVGRAKFISDDIFFFETYRDIAESLVNMQNAKAFPLRVTHNDTKYNNILIDDKTGKALCVIDLDTVMPGLSLYDYGDAVRFAASTAIEDEPDLSKVGVDLILYEQFTHGFVSSCSGFLEKTELKNMALGGVVLTIELASRFMADYLDGDKYFKVTRTDHNLQRARNQIKLAQDMLNKYDKLCNIVERYI